MATAVLAILAVSASLLAAWWGLSWLRVAQDDSVELGMLREEVLQDAQQAAISVNTLDYRRVQGGFELWEQSATGAALEDFRTHRDDYVRQVVASKATSTARVREGAVAELDDGAGIALVVIGVDVTYLPEQREASCDRQRLRLQMKRTPDGWKVEQLTRVGSLEPVPGPCPATTDS